MQVPSLVLASASPRRHDLLLRLVRAFHVIASAAEQEGSTLLPVYDLPPLDLPPAFTVPPAEDPRLWAWRKAADVLEVGGVAPDSVILGADTVVVAPSRLLGKPRDSADAIEMLWLLRGRPHIVVTGYALLHSDGAGEEIGAMVTEVRMRNYSRAELERYVASGEAFDKAGAYALQGLGGQLVESVEGCVCNVVGLPLCTIRPMLQSADIEVLGYPDEGFCHNCPLATETAQIPHYPGGDHGA